MISTVELTTRQMQQDAVYALAGSGDTLYAARTSGLYRSQDGGATWQDAFASLKLEQPLTATAVATVGSTVFAGVTGAVLRSDDAGDSWHIARLSSPPPHVAALAMSPIYREDGVVVAGTTEDGVFVSIDRGMTWTPWNFGLVDPHVYALVISLNFSQDRTLFAGTETGVFGSQNSGRGWRETLFPMDAAPVLSLAMSPDGRLYAGTENNGLFASHDFGMNWIQINHDLITTAINAIHTAAYPKIWLLLEDKLLRSPNGGVSWEADPRQLLAGKLPMTLLPLPTSPDTVMVGFAEGDILPLS